MTNDACQIVYFFTFSVYVLLLYKMEYNQRLEKNLSSLNVIDYSELNKCHLFMYCSFIKWGTINA